jgi:hypothetical protein
MTRREYLHTFHHLQQTDQTKPPNSLYKLSTGHSLNAILAGLAKLLPLPLNVFQETETEHSLLLLLILHLHSLMYDVGNDTTDY